MEGAIVSYFVAFVSRNCGTQCGYLWVSGIWYLDKYQSKRRDKASCPSPQLLHKTILESRKRQKLLRFSQTKKRSGTEIQFRIRTNLIHMGQIILLEKLICNFLRQE